MTTAVVTVTADMPVPQLARVLLHHGVSGVPVLDIDGAPIGMVSEGDLAMRDGLTTGGEPEPPPEPTGRRDWWLELLADPAPPDGEYLQRLRSSDRTVAAVMTTPVITVGEATDVAEISQLLARHRIKRVPVVKDGHVTGIVSRADLLRVLATGVSGGTLPALKSAPSAFLSDMFGTLRRVSSELAAVPSVTKAGATEAVAAEPAAAASGFRTLEADFHRGEIQRHDDARAAADKLRHETVNTLMNAHVSDDAWRQMLQHARTSAEHGATEWLVLRFPSQLCRDGGRAINIADAAWPATLRGEAAELYLRFEQELKPAGFRLSARVLEFPGGMPGDIGLFVVWGE